MDPPPPPGRPVLESSRAHGATGAGAPQWSPALAGLDRSLKSAVWPEYAEPLALPNF